MRDYDQNEWKVKIKEKSPPSLSTVDSEALERFLLQAFQKWFNKSKTGMQPLSGLIVLCDSTGKKLATTLLQPDTRLESLLHIERWDLDTLGINAIGRCLSHRQPEQVTNAKLRTESDLPPTDTYAEAITGEQSELLAVLGFVTADSCGPVDPIPLLLKAWAASLEACLFLEFEKSLTQQLTAAASDYDKELKKREILFQVAKKLHANIDVDSVLNEIIHSMKEIYPYADTELYLSQDSQSTLLTVRPLILNPGEEEIHVQAFIEGRTVSVTEETEDGMVSQLAVPLCGQQGVYGVLHVTALERLHSPEDLDVHFISQLADSAGTAFENARLYESSNVLVNELRLINEITRRLNQSLKLNEVFEFASDELIKIFKADYGLILQTDNENDKMVVQSSNLSNLSNDTYTLDYGFAGIMIKTKEPIIISDYSMNPKVRSKLMESTGARSLIGSPILVGAKVVGVILVAHRLPHYFSYDNYKLLQVLSGHIGLAITNASLHAEVRRMVVTDRLTGLYVRHYLDEQINLMQKKDFCGSLIIADIDHFKTINDTYGHQIGDQCLKQVSHIIKSSIRDTDIAARWGGEELAVYLPQLAIEQTCRIAQRIKQRVEHETDPMVTVSCGVSEWSWEDEKISVESLFYRADMALYEAKRCGRNQVKIG